MPIHGEFYNPNILRLVIDRFPLVLIDRTLKGIEACTVATDNKKAAHTLASHLLDLGHRHIAFLSQRAEHTSSIEARIEGFLSAFASRDLRSNPAYHLTDLKSTTLPFDRANIQHDRDVLSAFIDRHPEVTAFFVCEHDREVVLTEVLKATGRRVPGDISVATFDSVTTPFSESPFTRIQQDERTMGRTAVDLLIAQVRGEAVPMETVVDFTLVRGASTQPPATRTA